MPPEASDLPPVLHYAVAPVPRYKWLLTPLRIAAFIALFWWGYLIAAIPRGSSAGFSIHITLFMTIVYSGPAAVLAFMGLPSRRYVAVLVLVVVLPALIAEGQAMIEERLFLASVKNLPRSSAVVSKPRRWWPNGSSTLYYNPQTGRLAATD